MEAIDDCLCLKRLSVERHLRDLFVPVVVAFERLSPL